MRRKRHFLKQKLTLYFDEHIPAQVIAHFRTTYWRKKVNVVGAEEVGMKGRDDKSHYDFCSANEYTMVSMDMDFNNDTEYPFTTGRMPGIILLQASPSEPRRTIDLLRRVLQFILMLPLPRAFLMETNLVAQRDGAVMRGRNASTKEIKAMQVVAGQTTISEVRTFFSY